MIEDDDRALVGRVVVSGDEAAFRALYRRHTPGLHALAVKLLGAGERDVSDVIQDAWCRAAPSFGSFRWDSALRTWLAGIVVNCCRERIRLNMRSRTGAPHRGSGALHPAPEQRLDVRRAVDALSSRRRTVLVLHDVEGYTHEEIASILSISPGTSKSLLSRGRADLRHRLAGGDAEG